MPAFSLPNVNKCEKCHHANSKGAPFRLVYVRNDSQKCRGTWSDQQTLLPTMRLTGSLSQQTQLCSATIVKTDGTIPVKAWYYGVTVKSRLIIIDFRQPLPSKAFLGVNLKDGGWWRPLSPWTASVKPLYTGNDGRVVDFAKNVAFPFSVLYLSVSHPSLFSSGPKGDQKTSKNLHPAMWFFDMQGVPKSSSLQISHRCGPIFRRLSQFQRLSQGDFHIAPEPHQDYVR